MAWRCLRWQPTSACPHRARAHPRRPLDGLYAGINFGWAASNNALGDTTTDTGTAGLGAMVGGTRDPRHDARDSRRLHRRHAGRLQLAIPPDLGRRHRDRLRLARQQRRHFGVSLRGVGGVPGAQHDFRPGASTRSAPCARGSAGCATPLFLAYATGGLAYGETRARDHVLCPSCVPQAAVSSTSSGYSTGWTVGAGLEWQFAPQWSVKGEYLWVDLGSRSETIAYPYGATFNSTLTSSVHQRDGIVRTGLTYRFW